MDLQRSRRDLDEFFGLDEIFALVEEKFLGIKGELESKNERILKLERSLEEKIAEAEFLKLRVGNLEKENSEHLKNIKDIKKLNKELQENLLIIGRKVTENAAYYGQMTEIITLKENQKKEIRENSFDGTESEYYDSAFENLMESTVIDEDKEDVINLEFENLMESTDIDEDKENVVNVEGRGLKVSERHEKDDQEYSCQECPYKTNRNVQFKVHKLTHTGERISEIINEEPIDIATLDFILSWKSGLPVKKDS